MRILVDLDAAQLLGRDAGEEAAHADVARKRDHRLLEVEQLLERHVQEVAATTRRVEHAHRRDLAREPHQQAAQFARDARARHTARRIAPRHQRLCLGLHRVPAAAQRQHQHRLDDQQDIVAAGVVRAELRTLGGVERACEQRAQDRRLDAAPVERAHARQDRQRIAIELQHRVIVEQPPVEVRHVRIRKEATARHLLKQLAQLGGEQCRSRAGTLDQPRKHRFAQQAGILGKQTEQQPDEEVRDLRRGFAPFAQVRGELGEFSGGLRGDLRGGLRCAERFAENTLRRRWSPAGVSRSSQVSGTTCFTVLVKLVWMTI